MRAVRVRFERHGHRNDRGPIATSGIDLGFELSNLCNLHCTHCIRGSHQAQIDTLTASFVHRVLDEAAAQFERVSVVFTGGEPLSAQLFPEAVAAVAGRGMPYRVVTNGWLIPRHVALLTRHRPLFVRVSLSGATEATHDAQRGRGSFRRALLGIATLRAHAIRAELSLVLSRQSVGEVEKAVTIAATLGAAELHVILPQPTAETALAGSDLSPDEWREAGTQVRGIARRNRLPVVLDYGSYLPMPRDRCDTMRLRHLYIDARGRAAFCCQLSRYGSGEDPLLGDLTRETLSAIVARARDVYDSFHAETERLHHIGQRDALDDYPCVSCARRHGRTGFLSDFPQHPWAGLAKAPGDSLHAETATVVTACA
jgi:MoaA/NifB/PqqE/SkfB family radical SAM enzyme